MNKVWRSNVKHGEYSWECCSSALLRFVKTIEFKCLYLSYPNYLGHFGWVFYLTFLVSRILSYKTKGPDDMIFKVLSRRFYLFLIFWLVKMIENKEDSVKERQMKEPKGTWDL